MIITPIIEVVNIRDGGPEGEYIGRPCPRYPKGSPLQNTHWFRHGPKDNADRELSIAYYANDLEAALRDPKSAQSAEVARLAGIARRDGHLRLVCWCKPKACHGDVVRLTVLSKIAEEDGRGKKARRKAA